MNTTENRNLEALEQYFRDGCKWNCVQKLGLEIEHLILREDSLEAVTYGEAGGVASLLEELAPLYPRQYREEGQLLGLYNNDYALSLEPAGQLEVSIVPKENLRTIQRIYESFLGQILPLLDKRRFRLATLGYQPVSRAGELPLIPKKRYEYMDRYFQTSGTCGRNMMRGTAATQVSIDYCCEEDFRRKYQGACLLMPALKLLSDNTPVFEGRPWKGYLARTYIWDRVDPVRCGMLTRYLRVDFGFRDYAEYLWRLPLIFLPGAEGGRVHRRPRHRGTVRGQGADSGGYRAHPLHDLPGCAPEALYRDPGSGQHALCIRHGLSVSHQRIIFPVPGTGTAAGAVSGHPGGYFCRPAVPGGTGAGGRDLRAERPGISGGTAGSGRRPSGRGGTALPAALPAAAVPPDCAERGGLWNRSEKNIRRSLKQIWKRTGRPPGKTREYLLHSSVAYHGRCVRTLQIPKVFTPAALEDFRQIVRITYGIFQKVIREYLDNPAYRQLFPFSRELEELILVPSLYDSLLPIARFDIFYNEETGDFKFCEINTDGTSAMNEDYVLNQALDLNPAHQSMKRQHAFGTFELYDSWVRTFLSIYDTYEKKKEHPHVVIADFLENASITEFEEFQRRFEKAGVSCEIAEITELTFRDRHLISPTGRVIDAVYRRAVTSDVMAHAREVQPFLQAVKEQAVVSHRSLSDPDHPQQVAL